MVPVLEAVPNFSAGRDRSFLDRLIRAAEEGGTDVLDASADPDHHRAVLTLIGPPPAVEDVAVVLARMAIEEIDLRGHSGVHPRVGALDVLPFVPLSGLSLEDARASARRVGARLAGEVNLPVYFYGAASDPPGRGLAELRRGGFEAIADSFPAGREPDLLPPDWEHRGAHPTAGAVCVGARRVLLAWNIEVEGLAGAILRGIAQALRERGGGFGGLRAIAIDGMEGRPMQISMNLEEAEFRDPFAVYAAVEAEVRGHGGRVVGTEVIGLLPDRLLSRAGADRLRLVGGGEDRMVSPLLARHLQSRVSAELRSFLDSVEPYQDALPADVSEALRRLIDGLGWPHTRGEGT